MLIFLLFLFITLFAPLHGMHNNQIIEFTKKDYWLLKGLQNKSYEELKKMFHPRNVDIYGNLLNIAVSNGYGPLTKELIIVCLPEVVVENNINPYLARFIAAEYKHKLIAYKHYEDLFKTDIIDYNKQWGLLSRHDGTFSVVPTNIGFGYAMWHEKNKYMRHTITHENKKYRTRLRSLENKKGIHCILAAPSLETPEDHGKKFILFAEKDSEFLPINRAKTPRHPVSHYLFSGDNTYLAFCVLSDNKKASLISIFKLALCKKLQWGLNGSTSALCSAHHSPVFVAGSDKSYTFDLPNLIVTREEEMVPLRRHIAPITCVELSPDDTRLLTCSYNATDDTSQLCLWDTRYFDDIICIQDEECCGRILKTFFICNGKQIVTINNNGCLGFYDGLTGKSADRGSLLRSYHPNNQDDQPIIVWSNKNNLLISVSNDIITIRKSQSGKFIILKQLVSIPTGMGLSADESTIVFVDEQGKIHRLELYNNQDLHDINFIENHANFEQLYEMLKIYQSCSTFVETDFIKTMKSYIDQQNQSEKK